MADAYRLYWPATRDYLVLLVASLSASRRNFGLDSLRGLAVVAVLAYHLGFLSGGFLGVDVFFVLSGYLVTALALQEHARTGGFSVKAFWFRRFKRLAPAVFVVVPTVLGAAYWLDWERSGFRSLGWDATATLGWWANWRLAYGADTGYWGGAPSLFRHTWSLSVEEQFYLVWPLLLLAAFGVASLVTPLIGKRRGRLQDRPRRVAEPDTGAAVAWVAGAVMVASAGWMLWLSHQVAPDGFNRIYLGTDTRIFAPALGAFVAVIWPLDRQITNRATRAAVRLAALGSAVVVVWLMTEVEVFDPALYRQGILLLVAALSAVMLIGFSTLSRVDPLTSWLGRRSYGIYLWSWPIQLFVSDLFPYATRATVAAVVVALSLVIAEVSWHLVEYPAQRGVRWARYSPSRHRVAVALALVSVAAIAAVFSTSTARFGLPQMPGDLALMTAAGDEPGASFDVSGSAGGDEEVFGSLSADGEHSQRSDSQSSSAAVLSSQAEALNGDSISDNLAPLPGVQGGLGQGQSHHSDQGFTKGEEGEGQVVLLYGDSVALTMYEYFPWADPPEGIVSVIGRADIGCGLLAPLKYEFPYVGIYAAVTREHCVNNDAWLAGGLALHPDVVVLMPGAWEWSEARSPNGEMIEAQSPQMAALVGARIGELARRVDAAGARTVVLPWACPGHRDDLPQRREASYINWINGVFEAAVADAGHVQIELAELPPGICQGDDPSSRPTSAKNDAFKNEIHVRDAAGGWWVWHNWIGPSIVEDAVR